MTVRITARTLRHEDICLNGARRMCPSLGVDFRRLMREGYPVDEVRHINDVTVKRLIERAEAEAKARDGKT